MRWSDLPWVQTAGYGGRRNAEALLMVGFSFPFLWCAFRGEFETTRFLWSSLAFIAGTSMTILWAESGMRCRLCGIPFIVYRFLESARERENHRFLDPTRCPYCGDDGTGKTGDLTSVDRAEEARKIGRSLRTTALVSLAVLGIAFLAAAAFFLVVAYRHRPW